MTDRCLGCGTINHPHDVTVMLPAGYGPTLEDGYNCYYQCDFCGNTWNVARWTPTLQDD